MSSGSYDPVRKLAASDNVEVFDFGQPALNQFLQRFALSNQNANSAQTYVSCKEGWLLVITASRSAALSQKALRPGFSRAWHAIQCPS